jgi:peroxiredoxin
MRLKPIIFFVLVASVAGYFVYEEATRQGPGGLVNVGDIAPDFELKDGNGKLVKLSDYRGKLVFLNFWYTDCVPCIQEMPEMELMHNLFKDRNFQMLAVSVDANWSSVEEFYQKHNLTLLSLSDPGHNISGMYKVFKFPETFIIDASGRVLKHYVGPERWTNPAVMAQIESMIPTATSVPQTSGRD